ncbi:MAG: Flp family type IVb pilin [Devosia sp.]
MMKAFKDRLAAFAGNEDGATAIEYGLIAAMIAVGIMMAMQALGGGVMNLFGYIQTRAGNELDNINDL